LHFEQVSYISQVSHLYKQGRHSEKVPRSKNPIKQGQLLFEFKRFYPLQVKQCVLFSQSRQLYLQGRQLVVFPRSKNDYRQGQFLVKGDELFLLLPLQVRH
jgi:hypothetical protein